MTSAMIATTGDRFLPGTISIVHRDDANRFGSPAHESFLVVVRADRSDQDNYSALAIWCEAG